MAVKKFKPTTNGRRGMSTLANETLTKKAPEKSLLVKKTKTGGTLCKRDPVMTKEAFLMCAKEGLGIEVINKES